MQPSLPITSDITDESLESFVMANYAKASLKSYLAVLRLVRAYSGENLSPEGIDAAFVAGFRVFLADRLSPGSISQYLRSLRSLLNAYLGPEYRGHLKEAFRAVSSKNETDTRCITAEELMMVKDSHAIEAHVALDKARALFLLSTLLGGMPLEAIRGSLSMMTDGARFPLRNRSVISMPPQAVELMADFDRRFGSSLCDYVKALSDDDYAHRLDAIGALLRLRHPMLPKSAADGWVAFARKAGAPAAIIAASVNADVALLRYTDAADYMDADDIEDVYRAVADSIESVSRHWYGMRCFAASPEDIRQRLVDDRASLGVGDTDIYIPFSADCGGERVMQPMLFYNATPARAREVKRALGTDVYVYSYRSGDKAPAVISDTEMMTFMLLANVGGDTIRCYFPGAGDESPDFKVNDTVAITDGTFTGRVGIIEKTSADSLRVVVRIAGISALVTAEIPKKFLLPTGDRL